MSQFEDIMHRVLAAKMDEIQNQDQAASAIMLLKELHAATEKQIASLAVEYRVHVYLGEYGYGRHVALEESEWYDYKIGEWVSSSTMC